MSGRLKGVEFDYSLFDEASQVHLPLAIMGMMEAQKWVFFGDHQQLPPVLPTVPSEGKVHSSIFGFLQDRDFCVMLDTTYRLCDKLCEWPAEQFYDTEEVKLRPHPSVAKKRLVLSGTSSVPDQVLDPAVPLVHIEVHDPLATTSSNVEANEVIRILEQAVLHGVKPEDLAVVTPFRRQNRAIRNLLRKRLGKASEEIAVDTVERMQGQEREMVIVSLTSGSDAFVERIAEFYFQPQRLNVAATRARCKLVLVGRSDWSDLFERRPDLEEHGVKLADLLSRATKITLGWTQETEKIVR
jgi:DNA replication ATP-dependent helicase Dna2